MVPAAGHVADPELARTLGDIEGLITARTHALVTGVLHRPPAWAVPLGPPPRDSAARWGWLDALSPMRVVPARIGRELADVLDELLRRRPVVGD